MNDKFEWDSQKAKSNLIDHKVSFDLAVEIFNGPRVEALDTRDDYGEDRYVIYWRSRGPLLGRGPHT